MTTTPHVADAQPAADATSGAPRHRAEVLRRRGADERQAERASPRSRRARRRAPTAARVDPLADHHDGEGARAPDDDRPGADVAEVVRRTESSRDTTDPARRTPEDRGQLVDDDDDPDARHEPRHDGQRQEVREPPEPQQARPRRTRTPVTTRGRRDEREVGAVAGGGETQQRHRRTAARSSSRRPPTGSGSSPATANTIVATMKAISAVKAGTLGELGRWPAARGSRSRAA